MTPADRQPFLEVLGAFADLKGKKLTSAALELYWRAMQHWPLEEFQDAAAHLLRTCEFMPMPRDFENLRKAGRPTAGEAWAQVLAIARCGGTESGDELTDRAAAAIGGYRAVSMSETDRTPFLERRFCEHYEAIQEAEEARRGVPQIASACRQRLNGPQPVKALLSASLERHEP
jgi:hypothetical protein